MTETQQVADDPASPAPVTVLRLTPWEWRTVLERRSFLEGEDNRFETPRLFCGHPVQIVPDDSFR